MQKRVLTVVILGLVLIGIFSAFYFGGVTGNVVEQTNIDNPVPVSDKGSFSVFSNEYKDCVYERGIDAIRLVGLQGGYVAPYYYIETEYGNVAYWDDGESIALDKNTLEEELEDYLEETILYCEKDFRNINQAQV